MYGFNRSRIGTMYPAGHSSSPLFANSSYVDKSDIGLMSVPLTIGEQGGVDLDDSKLEQKLDKSLGIEGVVHDVPGDGILGDIGKFAFRNIIGPAVSGLLGGGLSPPGTGLSPPGTGLSPPGTGLSPPGAGVLSAALELDKLRGSGAINFKKPFSRFSRNKMFFHNGGIMSGRGLVVPGDGLQSFLGRLKNITNPFIRKEVARVLPVLQKRAIPLLEKQLESGLGKLTSKLENSPELADMLPADKLKMDVLKKLKKSGKGIQSSNPRPKLVIHHPAMDELEGGQLGILAGLASSLIAPALGGILKNIF
jgi:hypothetical protein